MSYASVPNNVVGAQEPFEGNGYAGCISFEFTYNYREIFGTDLADTMYPSNTYIISMRVSRANGYPYTAASNNLGIKFTTQKVAVGNSAIINNFAQLYSDTLITDSTNWVLLHWNYIPDSAYSHMYIGNFFDDAHTDTMALGDTPAGVYYYIDSVTVECIGKECMSAVPEIELVNPQIQYLPENSRIYIHLFSPSLAFAELRNTNGEIIFLSKFFSSLTIPVGNISSGLYLLQLRTNQNNYTQKILIIN